MSQWDLSTSNKLAVGIRNLKTTTASQEAEEAAPTETEYSSIRDWFTTGCHRR